MNKLKNYITNLGQCPECGSDELSNKDDPVEGKDTSVQCDNCGHQWKEPYEFAE